MDVFFLLENYIIKTSVWPLCKSKNGKYVTPFFILGRWGNFSYRVDLLWSLWSTPLYSNKGRPSLYMYGQNLSNRTGRTNWKLHGDILNAQMHHKQQVYDYRTHHCQPLIAASASLLLSLLHYAMKYSNAIRQLQHQPSKLHVMVSSSVSLQIIIIHCHWIILLKIPFQKQYFLKNVHGCDNIVHWYRHINHQRWFTLNANEKQIFWIWIWKKDFSVHKLVNGVVLIIYSSYLFHY